MSKLSKSYFSDIFRLGLGSINEINCTTEKETKVIYVCCTLFKGYNFVCPFFRVAKNLENADGSFFRFA